MHQDPAQQLVETLEQLLEHDQTHRLNSYKPYPYQLKFHNAKGWRTQIPAQVKALIAANQIGKTLSVCVEDVYHLTGLYPVWWKGHRFNRAIHAVIGTYTNEQTRDVLQAELCGDPFEPDSLGTGWIPKHLMDIKPTTKAGVPAAFDTILVKHVSGQYSRGSFRSYDIGAKKFYGRRVDYYHLDEEPPMDVYDQCVRGTLSRENSLINLTFTAEHGKTELWLRLKQEKNIGHYAMGATWDDCPHFQDPKVRKREEAKIPERLRKLRTKGIPVMGSGLIYPYTDEEIMCEPFEIPRFWPRIKSIDFGIKHGFALGSHAWDRENDVWYLYRAEKKSDLNIATMASMINAKDKWIPVAWPHDLNKRDAKSGKAWKEILSNPPYDCNMLPMVFSNPSDEFNKQDGGQAVWPGIYSIRQWIEEGRFKVFNNLSEWFDEKSFYHEGDNGKIVEVNDDLMDMTRYGFQMRRFATTPPKPATKRVARAGGARNW